MKILVCIPASRDLLERIRRGDDVEGPIQAFAATPALREGFAVSDDEEAEYAAFLAAGLWALRADGERLVMTAQVPATAVAPGREPESGGVRLDALKPRSVEAFFTDDVRGSALATRLADLSFDEAWEDEEFQALLTDHPMSWHSVTEL